MNKKKYMTPQTEIFDIETNDLLELSAEIQDPTIEGSRQLPEPLEDIIFKDNNLLWH